MYENGGLRNLTEAEGKITVIVPVYNAEPYLPQCIESILRQTYPNLQIILVDDGSTDGSGMICDKYAGMDGRIEVYHTENRGLVAARKLGIRCSTGKYVGFVDADDYIDPEMYELLLKDIIESRADFVHTGYIQETENENENYCYFEEEVLNLPDVEEREKALVKYVLQAEKERYISYSIWSKLFDRKLIEKCYLQLPDRQQYGEDLLCLCLCILESRHIKLSKRTLYHYKLQKKSLSHLSAAEQMLRDIELNHSIICALQSCSQEIYKKLELNLCYFMKNKFLNIIESINEGKIHIPRYYYKNIDLLRGKKIIIYGAGNVGQDYYLQFCKYKDIDITAWLDSNSQKCLYDYAVVSDISELTNYTFEKIIIAVKSKAAAEEMKKILFKYSIPEEAILWEAPESI